ncbi:MULTISPECIES: hypothetical protein [Burkholderia]|uniref:hypothetical protein n=2 Tax=Burkholderia TaxID=32008 RepID=UPI0005D7A650|nr:MULTISPECIES: hypothetical protein [Burkholderia]AJY32687.1 hypothetical protein BTM_4930 [Burkholderia thailandensis 34]MDR8916639.1 hypothetical protein [Burkholderia multivorans]MDR8922036.1 hypothetical protein [Burkholderia multivorans]MDR8969530.1 hypothetical protein [Burkholderia multivorans]MDR8991044.1 hypothetical protein [Burkholderia multivorans]
MLSNVLEGASWIALGAAALCVLCSLYVVFFYSTYAQWYVERNRIAPSRLRGYAQCVGWGIGMLVVAVLCAVGASKVTPPPGSDVDGQAEALLSGSSASSRDMSEPSTSARTAAQSAQDAAVLARHTAELLDRLDAFVLARPELLSDSLTYYRGFDDPIVSELDRWRALGTEYSDAPALCRDALVRLQSIGIAIHGGSIAQKYVQEDKEKYSTLKRRCKAAIAGKNAEAVRRE